MPRRELHKVGVHDDPVPHLSLYSNDPYDAALDDALREKWYKESLLLHGPMKPAGVLRPLEGPPTKADARDVALTLQRTLCEDWEGVEVAIYSNAQAGGPPLARRLRLCLPPFHRLSARPPRLPPDPHAAARTVRRATG